MDKGHIRRLQPSLRVYTARSYPLSKIAMGMNEEMGKVSWEKQKMKVGDPAQSPDFHLNEPVDPVEDLLKKEGPEGAVAELESRLKENPDDQEARRQLDLISNRLRDLVNRIGVTTNH